MTRSNLMIALYLGLVFLGGVAVGGFGVRLYSTEKVNASVAPRKTHEQFRQEYLAEMKTRLKLQEQQVTQLVGILDTTREEFRLFREATKPEIDRIQKKQIGAVEAMLDDTQKAEYRQMRAEREARKKAEGR